MKKSIKKNRKIVAVYSVWFFMHLVFLFLSSKTHASKFWPIDAGDYYGTLKRSYDFSEFLVYAIGPAVLIFAYIMFNGSGDSD